jgi:hypothetical protein
VILNADFLVDSVLAKSKVNIFQTTLWSCPKTKRKGYYENLLHLTGGSTKLHASYRLHVKTVEKSRNGVILKGTPGRARCPQLSMETIV